MEPRGARAPRAPGPRRHRGWPLILVGCAVSVLVGLPAALLRLRSATGHRAGAARVRRATGSATVLLVLLPERQSVLPNRPHVRCAVIQVPAPPSHALLQPIAKLKQSPTNVPVNTSSLGDCSINTEKPAPKEATARKSVL